jgi:hypothetical protein
VANSSSRRGGGGGQINSSNGTGISRKDLLKYKDIKVRKWITKPLVFYTLNGSEVKVPSWQSGKALYFSLLILSLTNRHDR